jgi:predicted methyltransferase
MEPAMTLLRHAIVLSLGLGLVACGQNEAPPAPSAPAEPAPVAAAPAPAPAATPLDAAIDGSWRTPEFVARDAFRNPRETLAFFGVEPGHTVVEITPGGGWYTEILAPYLKDSGRYLGAIVDPASAATERARDYYAGGNDRLREKLAGNEVYAKAELVEYDIAAPRFGEDGSADVVLTFRNVHNWMGGGQAPGMFEGFFAVLRPGGVLGVVEHRANADVPEGDRSGYVSEAQVVALATAAGFVLEESSEVNANPNDTKDHPNGVWTLPPTLRVPEGEDVEKYRAIGESDRMTLRFRKPAGEADGSDES